VQVGQTVMGVKLKVLQILIAIGEISRHREPKNIITSLPLNVILYQYIVDSS